MASDRKTKTKKNKLLVIMERRNIIISCIYVCLLYFLPLNFNIFFCKGTYGNGMVMVKVCNMILNTASSIDITNKSEGKNKRKREKMFVHQRTTLSAKIRQTFLQEVRQ